ncbi:MAG: DUF6020 family protein [Coriobacteriales bacterium]|jgi:hypothetical protein|nr:DUF6020 family protein [Coriobacteriales bacterium]
MNRIRATAIRIFGTLFADRRRTVILLVLSALFALSNVFVQPVFYRGSIDQITSSAQGWITALVQILGLTVGIAVILAVICAFGRRFFVWIARFNPLPQLTFGWHKRSVLLVAAVIMILWLPWIIIYFPGSAPYDAIAQIYQMHGSGALRPEVYELTLGGWISNSHPVLHTLILGAFFELGHALGSQDLGIFMYTFFQCLVRAVSFAAVCCYIRRIGAPQLFCLLALVFFGLFPAISTSSVVIFKDHLYSPLYAIYLIFIIEIVLSKGEVLGIRKFIIGLSIIATLLALLKHPGIYIVVGSAVLLALVYRRQIKSLLVSVLLPIVTVSVLLPFVVFPALNIVPAGSQDLFGPFFMQTAKVIKDHPEAMGPEERDIIDQVVPYRVIATGYSVMTSDYLKGNFRQNSTLSQKLDYLLLWLRQGFEYPKEYFEGYFVLEDSWIVPLDGWEVYDLIGPHHQLTVIDVVGHNNRLPQNKARDIAGDLYFGYHPELTQAKQFMRDTFLHTRTVPVIGFFYSVATYTFYFPLLFLGVVLLNRRSFLPVFLPVALSFMVLMVSPMAMSRYALPFLESTPLLFTLAILAFLQPQTRAMLHLHSSKSHLSEPGFGISNQDDSIAGSATPSASDQDNEGTRRTDSVASGSDTSIIDEKDSAVLDTASNPKRRASGITTEV